MCLTLLNCLLYSCVNAIVVLITLVDSAIKTVCCNCYNVCELLGGLLTTLDPADVSRQVWGDGAKWHSLVSS